MVVGRGWWLSTALLGFGAVFAYFMQNGGAGNLPLHAEGIVEPRFDKVRDVFRQNFVDGWERGGASFAVFVEGKKVVDIWGGYADRAAMRKWNEDTIAVVFSTTKGVAAVAVALLVDRGLLSYDDLVVKHWPEFGQHGKGNVTVQMMLSHMAGVPFLDGEVSVEEASSPEIIGRRLAEQKPCWPPGTASGYHVYTYGWLVDQLIRRVDPGKRSIGQFVKDELATPYGVDFHIGLALEHAHRVAHLTAPSVGDRLSEIMTDYRVAKYLKALFKLLSDSYLSRALFNLPWLDCVHKMTVNNGDFHSIEQAAALGIGNARSLATLFSLLGEGQLVGSATLAQLQRSTVNSTDLVMDHAVAKGNGFFMLPLNRAGSKTAIGHTGHGCQQVQLDVANRVAIAYTTNALKTGLADLCRTWRRLQDTVYSIIEEK